MRHLGLVVPLAIALWAVPAVAWAHAGFVSSTPEPGSELSSAPGVVVLRFSGPLNQKLSRATAATRTGDEATGRVTGPDQISVDLTTNAHGVYEVRWTTVSLVDGHTLTGRVSCTARRCARRDTSWTIATTTSTPRSRSARRAQLEADVRRWPARIASEQEGGDR